MPGKYGPVWLISIIFHLPPSLLSTSEKPPCDGQRVDISTGLRDESFEAENRPEDPIRAPFKTRLRAQGRTWI
jgi:hypothetical protein